MLARAGDGRVAFGQSRARGGREGGDNAARGGAAGHATVSKMLAMTLRAARTPLEPVSRDTPTPGPNQVLLRVRACAVCRTDLHIVDGDLPLPRLPLVPGHEIVATVEALGAGVTAPHVGERVGVPWLGGSCGHCAYCTTQAENLCDDPVFTGYTCDGGFATHVLADARYCHSLAGLVMDDASAAPLLCAGLIGWRALKAAGDAPVASGRSRVKRRTTEQAHICIGTTGLSRTDPDRFAFGVVNAALGGGMSSRLFQEIREQRGQRPSRRW